MVQSSLRFCATLRNRQSEGEILFYQPRRDDLDSPGGEGNNPGHEASFRRQDQEPPKGGVAGINTSVRYVGASSRPESARRSKTAIARQRTTASIDEQAAESALPHRK